MNRALQRRGVKRYSARKHGGGYGMGAPLVSIPSGPGSDWTFAVKEPINQAYSDCAIPARPGELFNTPNPSLAQVAMVGGGDDNLDSHAYMAKEWPVVMHTGNPATAWGDPALAQAAMAGGKRRRTRRLRGGRRNCGCSGSKLFGVARKSTRRMHGGRRNCGCSGSKLFGGARRTRRFRGGGTYGYAVDPSVSVGGNGPNVGALVAGVPCDGRAGAAADSGNPDPRAPSDLYSLTPNTMKGGAYSSGNAYGADCYKAPGSMLPVYEAQTAGFEFRPSTLAGATLPDGVTAYNEVVPVAARMGGARRRSRKAGKKSRKSRRLHRQNRK